VVGKLLCDTVQRSGLPAAGLDGGRDPDDPSHDKGPAGYNPKRELLGMTERN
jgi:hypothetical protein